MKLVKNLIEQTQVITALLVITVLLVISISLYKYKIYKKTSYKDSCYN